MLQKLIDQFLPETDLIFKLCLPLISIAVFAAGLSGWMKVKKKIRTPYTRKTFHFLIFSTAGLLQFYYGLKAVTFFGGMVFILVVIAVLLGERLWFFKALARESDAPHEKKFIILPLLATAFGGVLSNIFFPSTAYIGYFVGGWGDAVGEPVGTKWGKHRYTVPTLFGVRATRSIEGSTAVMLVSMIIAAGCMMQLTEVSFLGCILIGFICGIAACLVEAISSHGLDNLTIQLTASAVLHFFLSNPYLIQ
jgi:phytol kinase